MSIDILLSCLHSADHEKLNKRRFQPAIIEKPPPKKKKIVDS
jgi:hypothetical protein